jgi:hypothetical protein
MTNTATLYLVQPGHDVQGTNPATGRAKKARGTGSVVRTEERGFHGTVTVVRWSNGVETYHCT